MKHPFVLLLFLMSQSVFAENWGIMFPKAVLTNDCQSFSIGTQNGKNSFSEVINSDKTTSLNVQFYLNGQPNNRENREPYGSILTGDFYDGEHKLYLRTYYYSAPSQMPDKNPIELKAVITPKGQAPITVTFQFYVLAERWKFYYVNGMKFICPDQPINALATMGASAIMMQEFHFVANSINSITGEAKAVLDGDPTRVTSKYWECRPCNPQNFEVSPNWGEDIYTKIKDVKAQFDGSQMQVDFKIDYMDYLGYKVRPVVHNTGWIDAVPKQKGTKDATGKLVTPLQKEYKKQYLDKTSKLLLHVTSGYSLQASQ